MPVRWWYRCAGAMTLWPAAVRPPMDIFGRCNGAGLGLNVPPVAGTATPTAAAAAAANSAHHHHHHHHSNHHHHSHHHHSHQHSSTTTRSANLPASLVAAHTAVVHGAEQQAGTVGTTPTATGATAAGGSTSSTVGGGGGNSGAGTAGGVPAQTAEANATSQSRMQLTGAPAPGNAASPESAASTLADAYTKMTSDIFSERTLGDYMSEHHGELVRTGEYSAVFSLRDFAYGFKVVCVVMHLFSGRFKGSSSIVWLPSMNPFLILFRIFSGTNSIFV